ncbi:AAT family amino acid transporter [Pyrenochaeta sp. DS3sAY3a]|nr:AAT family amino acid transporter [Pyrenochaeta sp. DS3sAY3a]
MSGKEKLDGTIKVNADSADVSIGEHHEVNKLQRHLGNRQVQLIAIGGSIGTAIFVSIGGTLAKAGPGGLLLAWIIYCGLIGVINNSMAEMSTLMPISGGFPRLAGKWVDEAFGFMAGWNFFFYEALLVPFEITALTLVLSFWSDNIPPAAICAGCIALYGILNVLTVRAYGEAEFWLSGRKVILLFMMMFFTFFTMVGANPQRDVYGFRHWNNPGAFAEHHSTGSLGRFEGFLAALWAGSFAIVGPEYIAMVAGEAKHPRIYLKSAFKTIYWRFGLFFIGSALCVGIIVPYNDPTLLAIIGGKQGGSGTAAASPYVIGMRNLKVAVLPHITNALLATSIFSAGNTYAYCAIRSLHGIALEGRAPAFLQKCTKQGVPIWCVAVVMFFPLLSFLQVSNSSAQVLTWLVNLVTAGGAINFLVISTTYIFFYRACKAQEIDRKTFPYYGYFQPYCGWIGIIGMSVVIIFYGYSSFTPWDVGTFFSYYTMVIVAPILYGGWKLLKRTKIISPLEADLIWERPQIDQYEMSLEEAPVGFWTEFLQMFRIRKGKSGDKEA